MPTVMRFDGLRVLIYPNDHRPAHVHVRANALPLLCREWDTIHADY
jgi:hypothetical protein